MFEVVVIVTFLVILALLALLTHKIRKMHLMLYDIRTAVGSLGTTKLVETSQQLQLLHTLEHELDLPQGLPPTRGWAASPDFLLAIARHARAAQPRIIVECSSGVSTLVLARTAQLNGLGHVYSLEHDAEYAEATRQNLRHYKLDNYATVITAPLVAHSLREQNWPWYDLKKLTIDQPIDLLVIDGPPELTRDHARYPAGPLLFTRLAPGAAVFLDDAARPFEKDIVAWWSEENPSFTVKTPFAEKGCAVLTTPSK